MLTLALPNGSLREMTERIFLEVGINVSSPYPRKHWVKVGHPLVAKVVWLKAKDIPWVLYEGVVAEVGITGDDCFMEWHYATGFDLVWCTRRSQLCYSKSGFEPTKLALVASASDREYVVWPIRGEKIVTEFPYRTPKLLGDADFTVVAGSVEAYVGHGFRFGVTRVETGQSLRQNKLRIVRELGDSTPCIFANPNFRHGNMVADLAALLQEGLESLKRKEEK